MESENTETPVEEREEEQGSECSDELELRSPEEIEELLKQANIPSSEIATIVQSLYSSLSFDSHEQDKDYLVLEVDEDVKNAIEAGESITFRGDENEPAVLCIDKKTYEVKEAETSNTCLIVPNLKCSDEVFVEGADTKIIEKKEITFRYNKYLELKECRPRLGKLKTILEPSSFKGTEYEKLIDQSTLYNWERLQSEIQASDGEIREALAEYLIVEMDGYYRLISFEYEARAYGFMLDLIEENSWQLDEIDKDFSYESLKEIIPISVFEVLFKKYAEPSKTKEDGTQLYRYDEAKSCRVLANVLLNTCPVNKYDEFMKAWRIGCPDYLTPKVEYLYGIGIVRWNKKAMRRDVILFLESSLPENLNERLNILFKEKDRWTLEEITPYLEPLTTKTQNVNAILTKFTRSSTFNGVKQYSAKHGK